jgi:hypothetical protein
VGHLLIFGVCLILNFLCSLCPQVPRETTRFHSQFSSPKIALKTSMFSINIASRPIPSQ